MSRSSPSGTSSTTLSPSPTNLSGRGSPSRYLIRERCFRSIGSSSPFRSQRPVGSRSLTTLTGRAVTRPRLPPSSSRTSGTSCGRLFPDHEGGRSGPLRAATRALRGSVARAARGCRPGACRSGVRAFVDRCPDPEAFSSTTTPRRRVRRRHPTRGWPSRRVASPSHGESGPPAG
jgi:hypothetical protein